MEGGLVGDPFEYASKRVPLPIELALRQIEESRIEAINRSFVRDVSLNEIGGILKDISDSLEGEE